LRRVRKLQDRSPSACCSRGYELRCGLRTANPPRSKVTKHCQPGTSRTTNNGSHRRGVLTRQPFTLFSMPPSSLRIGSRSGAGSRSRAGRYWPLDLVRDGIPDCKTRSVGGLLTFAIHSPSIAAVRERSLCSTCMRSLPAPGCNQCGHHRRHWCLSAAGH
jgi:hypothetical protein